MEKKLKCELYNDSMQGWKSYPIHKAQLIIADVPYNVGTNFLASNPSWWKDGDSKNGPTDLAGKAAFYSDFNFNLFEYFHFCSRLMRKEPTKGGERGKSSDAPCMIVFCAFQQLHTLIEAAKKNGFAHYIPLVFVKKSSPQTLKANMRVCGATEYALLFYRSYLPKFRNNGKMINNWFEWERDGKEIPKIHPTQKPVKVLKRLIELFTDPGDVVIDPCAGSASTLRAARELGRNSYGFEISKKYYREAIEKMLNPNYIDESKQVEGQMNLFEVMGCATAK